MRGKKGGNEREEDQGKRKAESGGGGAPILTTLTGRGQLFDSLYLYKPPMSV
jgi:hypothetical protein